jgi:signal transduction histidine kinase
MSDDDARKLRDAEDRLLVEEVIAAMRHDVRNKLAAIRQAAYYLKTKTQTTELWEKDPRMARFFALIDEQVDAADEAFTTHSSLDKVHTRDPKPTSTRSLVDEAAKTALDPARVAIGTIEERDVPADRGEIVLVLRELLANAIEASPEGTPVTVSGRVKDASYVFTVVNEGPPIEPRSFRNFVRGFSSTREGRRGVGLSIARHVAARYGGSLMLREGQPRTTIDLSLSLVYPPPTDAQVVLP